MKYILAIDQGTTSTRAIAFNNEGKISSLDQKEHKQYYPKSGYVEHNAEEIWNNVVEVCNNTVSKIGGWEVIEAIGITNQRETIVSWKKDTQSVLAPAIVWQCRRTTNIVEKLIQEDYKELFKEKTGLVLDAYFSGTKIQWMINNIPEVKKELERENVQFGTIETFLINKMSGKHVTDVSNASRTLLFNLKYKKWDQELLDILKIKESSLPEVIPSVLYEPIAGYWKRENRDIPILGLAGDQQAALFGQTAFEFGNSKITYGTGNFALTNTGSNIRKSDNGLLTTVAWADGDLNKTTYALEGSVFITGALVQWLRDELEFFKEAKEIENLAKLADDIGNLVIVPAFVGLGAPYWDQRAGGLIIGLTRGSNKSHIAKAALESIAFQTYDLLKLMEEESGKKVSLRVDGGASQNDYLMQLQSNIIQEEITRPINIETTALGAAFMAGLGSGYWESISALKQLNPPETIFSPDKNYPRDKKLKYWETAVKRSLQWNLED